MSRETSFINNVLFDLDIGLIDTYINKWGGEKWRKFPNELRISYLMDLEYWQ